MNSEMMLEHTQNFDSSNYNPPNEHAMSQGNWWNETFKQSVIKEENEENE